MLHIIPASDLKEDFAKIEDLVEQQRENVYLTKNGYGSMVIMNIETYEKMVEKSDTKEGTKIKTKNKMTTKKINIPEPEMADD